MRAALVRVAVELHREQAERVDCRRGRWRLEDVHARAAHHNPSLAEVWRARARRRLSRRALRARARPQQQQQQLLLRRRRWQCWRRTPGADALGKAKHARALERNRRLEVLRTDLEQRNAHHGGRARWRARHPRWQRAAALQGASDGDRRGGGGSCTDPLRAARTTATACACVAQRQSSDRCLTVGRAWRSVADPADDRTAQAAPRVTGCPVPRARVRSQPVPW